MPPRQVWVGDFTFDRADVRAGRNGQRLADFKGKMTDGMSRSLVRSLTSTGLPVQRISTTSRPSQRPQPAWLVRGQFRSVHQGSRALRSVFGFGFGRTVLETDVQVYDLSVSSASPLLTFQTTGGSGAEPGGLLSPSPEGVGIAIGLKAVSGGLSFDNGRTARMIAAHISTELAKRGYIDPKKARKAKLLRGWTPQASIPAHALSSRRLSG